MRRVELKDGSVIESPWLRVGQAAVYCGISRTEFTLRAAGLPHSGDGSLRLYHVSVLDKWVNNEVPGVCFMNVPPPAAPAKRRPATGAHVLIDPPTGKAFLSPNQEGRRKKP
jgi:hypothetical protein